MASSTRKIDKKEWNCHKETILRLYSAPGGTLKSVAAQMRDVYGFNASLNQYEWQLNAWARKNLTKDVWPAILARYDSAVSQSLQARVLISGKPVSKEKLQRMRRRHKTPEPGGQCNAPQALHNALALSHVTIETLDSNGEWHEWNSNATGSIRRSSYSESNSTSVPRSDPAASPALLAGSTRLNPGLAAGDVGPFVPPPTSQDISSTVFRSPSALLSATELAHGESWALSPGIFDILTTSIPRSDSTLSPALIARSPRLNYNLSIEDINPRVALFSSQDIPNPLRRSPSPFASTTELAHGEPWALSPGTLDFLTTPGNELGGILEVSGNSWVSREAQTDTQYWHSPSYPIPQNSSLVRSQDSSRVQDLSFGGMLLFNQLDDWLWSMKTSTTTHNPGPRTTATMSWHGTPSTAEHETASSLHIHKEKDHRISRPFITTGTLVQRLTGFFPGVTPDWRHTATMSPEDVFKVNSTRLLLLSITNNFAGLEEFPARDTFKCLKNNGMLSEILFCALKSNRGYAARALAEHLFRVAILAGDDQITHQLLETGHVNANSKLLFGEAEKISPIQAAAAVRSPSEVQVLLKAGAQVQGEPLDFFWNDPPEEWTLSNPGAKVSDWAQNELLDITNAFLEAGAVPNLGHVVRSYRVLTNDGCRPQMLDLLLTQLRPVDHWCEQIYHATELMWELKSSQATQIITRLFRGSIPLDCLECSEGLEVLLLTAACLGIVEVAQSFLPKAISQNSPAFWSRFLCASIRGGNWTIINMALEKEYKTGYIAPHLPEIFGEQKLCRSRAWDKCDDSTHVTSPLAEAIRSKNWVLVQKLEVAGALNDLDRPGRLGPAIRAAVAGQDIEYAKKILMHAPRVEDIGYAPELVDAIEEGCQDLVQILLDAGASLCQNMFASSQGTTYDAILTALECKNAPIFHLLLDSGLFESNSTSNCIRRAVIWGDSSVISALVTATRSKRPSSHRPILLKKHTLSQSDWVDQELISSTLFLGVFTKTEMRQCLVFAVHSNNLPLIQELVEAGADPLDEEILSLAVEDSPTALRYLLTKAPETLYPINGFGSMALCKAVELGSQGTRSLDTLLSVPMVDKSGMVADGQLRCLSPLGLAIMRSGKRGSDLSIVERLLDAGCDANNIVKGDKLTRETALLVAVGTRNQELVLLLVQRGADINKKMTLGIKRTPLQRAAETGNLDMVRWFLDNGADVHAPAARRGGGTALQLAAIGGNCMIVAELLGRGADVHAAPSQSHGSWPLEGAAEHGRLEILEYLWKAAGGFNKFHCQQAQKFAEKNGHYACRDWLVDKLALLPDDSVMSL